MGTPGRIVARGATADIVAYGPGQVLKWFHSDFSREDAEEEARKTRAVHRLGIPAPAVGDVVEIDGRAGIPLEHVEGPSMLQALSTFPWPVARSARRLADLHLDLHQRHLSELPSRKTVMQRRIRAVALLERVRDEVLGILDRLPDGDAVLHGDLHPGNVLLSPRGPVIIDWMDVLRGDPLADVARTLLLVDVSGKDQVSWLVNRMRARLRRVFLERYCRGSGATEERILAWRRPTAAARLAENVTAEEPVLRAIAEGREGQG